MTRSYLRLNVTSIVLAMMVSAAGAQTQGNDVNAFIANSPIAGLPQGRYNDWSPEQRDTAFKRIGGFCQYLCVDTYGSTTPANAAAAALAKAEAKVCAGACIAAHLPPDFPQRGAMEQKLREDFEAARKLGSAQSWPLAKR